MFVLIFFLLGAALGSFLNVVIYRLPAGESVVGGRSKCPNPECGSIIKWYDNIPLLSFLLLRGRCRVCGDRISYRYPLVEFLTAMLITINAVYFGLGWSFLWASAFVLLVLPMAFIDAKHYILPNELTIGGAVFALLFALADLLAILDWPVSFRQALLGSVIGGGFLLLVSVVGSAILKKDVMGEGDVKMMAMVGAFLGWKSVFLTIFLGSALGTLIFGPISLRRKILVPFGVFLAIGGLVSLYFEDSLLRFYWGIFE